MVNKMVTSTFFLECSFSPLCTPGRVLDVLGSFSWTGVTDVGVWRGMVECLRCLVELSVCQVAVDQLEPGYVAPLTVSPCFLNAIVNHTPFPPHPPTTHHTPHTTHHTPHTTHHPTTPFHQPRALANATFRNLCKNGKTALVGAPPLKGAETSPPLPPPSDHHTHGRTDTHAPPLLMFVTSLSCCFLGQTRRTWPRCLLRHG